MRGITIVTGGNRGLGFETCRQLARDGTAVLLTARDERKARAAQERLSDDGLPVEAAPLDVTDTASMDALVALVKERWGAVAALVNNAGVALDGFDARVARDTLETNFYGPTRLTERFLPLLEEQARVVMVSSGLGELGGIGRTLRPAFEPAGRTREDIVALMERFVDEVERGVHLASGWPSSAYNVSKVGLNAWTRVLAAEPVARALHVNAVCPGWVRTDMGGSGAPVSIEDGADTIVWAATLPASGPTGGFFRDRAPAPW